MNDEKYKKDNALPDDYVEQKSCENCKFLEAIYGDHSAGDDDTFFCDFGQDYSANNDVDPPKTFSHLKYELWIEAREVKKCGFCKNHEVKI